MNFNEPESQTELPTRKGNIESSLYNADKLISLSSQAKVIAWIILVVSIVFLAAATINFWSDFVARTNYAYAPDIEDFIFYLASLFPTLIGAFLYIILRIIAEGIVLLMDLEIDLRERSVSQK